MKKSYIMVIVVVIVAALAVGGYFWYSSMSPSTTPTGTSPSQGSSTTAPQATNAIIITNFAFAPNSITIPVGTTVTWTNNDAAPHTIVSDAFASPEFTKNGSYQYTFNNAGTYKYYCGLHPTMTGTVIVQ